MQDLKDVFSGNLNLPFRHQQAANSNVSNPTTNIEVENLGCGIDAFLDDSDSLTSLNFHDGPPIIKPRPYQKEMLKESLERNIIVAMDTGSGKTHILGAVMRILHELDTIPSDQIIWFLAPTVALCSQQHEYIKSQITSVQTKFLSGIDRVECWTEQHHWDAVLKNVKVVTATYQILLDALTHGFVRMESLALIVFDEAHNCVKGHAGAKIMLNFYHRRKELNHTVPHILGLTASPVMRSDPRALVKIESTLDSICRTPTKHRSELRLQVKLPVLLQVQYQSLPPPNSLTGAPKSILSLHQAYLGLKVSEDPYFLSLVKYNDTEKGRKHIEKVRMSHKTWCHDQLKSFYATASKICQDLGPWAADFYISYIITKINKAADGSKNYMDVWDVSSAEKQYLAKALQGVEASHTSCLGFEDLHLLSDKVAKLIEVLMMETASFSGIVFVQERATAGVLGQLISMHPTTCGRFQTGTIVGTSGHSYRARNISELIIDQNEQKQTLSRFKSGQVNLAVATSILEEGIDVPACNTVICFQAPANLKSFVQRRGRARHRDSKLVLLLDPAGKKVAEWQKLELDMRKMYEDEMRTMQELLVQEDTETHDGRIFEIPKTDALLNLDNAVAHLYHFCAKLPRVAYVDRRPEFTCSEDVGSLIRAKVVLPLSVNEIVRVAESRKTWLSERNAIKDAAFQAYVALYEAGLVNDNLLPNMGNDILPADLRTTSNDTRASLEIVDEQLNPWIQVAKAWKNAEELHKYSLVLGDLEVGLLFPVQVPEVPPITFYWDSTTELSLHATSPVPAKEECRLKAPEDTWALLQSAFGARFPIKKESLVMQFATYSGIHLKDLMGRQDVLQVSRLDRASGLIRDKLDPYVAYTFKELLPGKPDMILVQSPYQGYQEASDSAHLSLTRLSKKSDFIRKLPPASNPPSNKPYSTVLPLARCTIDEIPLVYYQFGRLIPSIMHRFEKYLLATMLSNTLLKDVRISDLSLIATAISASSANSETNYQRLEFLGDTILKLCTSVQLMVKYPFWHEGYLTELKGRIVSNASLFAAAVLIGLDKFIITKSFSGHKWRPLYVDDLLEMSTDRQREMSSKIPADVVEALIGAAMLDGGLPKALKCLQTFIPRLDWQPLEVGRSLLFQRAPTVGLPSTLQPLEDLIGYYFRNKGLLIEAMTHASCNSGSASLERLEFLGDAILDHLVVEALWRYSLSHTQMHLMRTALVNADVLAFLCMEWRSEREIIDLENSSGSERSSPTEKPRTILVPLWGFMRHASPQVGLEQSTSSSRHATLAPQLRNAFESGSHYPWALLARLQAQKFYSDLVESLVAAVWIDSGSFEVCNKFIERIGIFKIMRRMLNEGVQVLNPKEELGMLADSETVKYVVSRPGPIISMDREERQRGLVCKVLVGEKEVVCVEGGVSTVEVETRAAEEAIRLLKEERMDSVMGDRSEEVGGANGEAEGRDEDGEDEDDFEMGDA